MSPAGVPPLAGAPARLVSAQIAPLLRWRWAESGACVRIARDRVWVDRSPWTFPGQEDKD